MLKATAEELGVRAVAFDASDVAAIEAALPGLPERVDLLVNNAGGNVGRRPAGDDLAGVRDLWHAQFEANVISAVLMTSALTPRLQSGGRVISIGSIAGARGGGAYGAAKAALHTWTGDLAFELGGRGITVNVTAPGYIEAPSSSATPSRRTAARCSSARPPTAVPASMAAPSAAADDDGRRASRGRCAGPWELRRAPATTRADGHRMSVDLTLAATGSLTGPPENERLVS